MAAGATERAGGRVVPKDGANELARELRALRALELSSEATCVVCVMCVVDDDAAPPLLRGVLNAPGS